MTTMSPTDSTVAACYARQEGNHLVLGNALFERRWRIANGLLHATSFRDLRTGREWLARASESPSPHPAVPLPEEPREVSLATRVERPFAVSVECLIAELTATSARSTLVYRFLVYPRAGGAVVQLTSRLAPEIVAQASVPVNVVPELPTGDETTLVRQEKALSPLDGLEHLNLAPRHIRLTRVAFQDVTDTHNELVQEHEWLLQSNETHLALAGNLFVLEDTLSGDGLVFIKHAPLPHARPVKTLADLRVHGKASFSSMVKAAEYGPGHPRWPLAYQFGFFGHGVESGEGEGYPFVVLSYQGGRFGRIRALQEYQRQIRPYVAGRDGLLLSNTWGDRSQNTRIAEDFLIREVEAGAMLGVDIMEVDDGWQRGLDGAPPSGSTDAWRNFWQASATFWDCHPERLPRGLDAVAEAVRRRGMQLGLWYVVDPHNDYANAARDAEKILEMHRRLGANYFKLDGVSIRSRVGERNFRRFVDTVIGGSGGRIVLDLDITAGLRHGYFGLMDNGPLFVENRYTDWHGYWPHQTLRNLWTLAQYVDPLRMRFEFLNNERNGSLYVDDPLAPSSYEADYLFATVMFSSPEAFFEVQNVSPRFARSAARAIRVWKLYRDEILGGTMVPIGLRPDGVSWTGFCSIARDGGTAIVLLFREQSPNAVAEFQIPFLDGQGFSCEILAGGGSGRFEDGRLRATIDQPRRFLLVRLSTARSRQVNGSRNQADSETEARASHHTRRSHGGERLSDCGDEGHQEAGGV